MDVAISRSESINKFNGQLQGSFIFALVFCEHSGYHDFLKK